MDSIAAILLLVDRLLWPLPPSPSTTSPLRMIRVPMCTDVRRKRRDSLRLLPPGGAAAARDKNALQDTLDAATPGNKHIYEPNVAHTIVAAS